MKRIFLLISVLYILFCANAQTLNIGLHTLQCVNDTAYIYDTVFVGKSYYKNGFEIPVQNTDTTIFDTLFLKNKTLCDSIVILNLNVLQEDNKIIIYLEDTIYMRDCDLPVELFTNIKRFSYKIIQLVQLSGALLEISNMGDLMYIPPKGNDAIMRDEIVYEINILGDIYYNIITTIFITPCHIAPMSISSTSTVYCLDNNCSYEGPSILINEVMINPSEYDGAIYGYQCDPNTHQGGEWIELYNPNACNSVDISGYFMANSTSDSPDCSGIFIRDIGATFVLPEGTVIPPNGFCVLRGERATVVDSARLVQNGGNTVVINLVEHFNRFCLDDVGNRFWLPNSGGWFGFYDRSGVPQDAVYWGNPEQDICLDCTPCNPLVSDSYAGELASLNDIPTDRKTRIIDFDLNPAQYLGNTPKRIPDGGAWQINTVTPPTQGFCNSDCKFRVGSNCDGTATVTVHKTGNYSYLWNDTYGQTTATATGLCEGAYCCTVTDDDTGLSEVICVTVTDNVIDNDVFIKLSEPICANDGEFYLFISKKYSDAVLPTHYKIYFSEKTVPNGWSNFVNQQGVINSDKIVVEMPEKVYPDHYFCTLTLTYSDFFCTEKSYQIPFTVFYPDTIMEQKWDDVIALFNEYYNGGFKYAGYQWYRNDEILPGEDYSYIYIRNGKLVIGDLYSVLITRADGSQIFSCPLEAHIPRDEYCMYPTIVNAGQTIKISLSGKTATVRLITVTGIVLSETVNYDYEFIAPAQQGVYLLEIISNNKTREVGKIIVK